MSPRIILTAGHCPLAFSSRGWEMYVRAGDLDVSQPPNIGTQIVKVGGYAVHQEFRGIEAYHDVALLFLMPINRVITATTYSC